MKSLATILLITILFSCTKEKELQPISETSASRTTSSTNWQSVCVPNDEVRASCYGVRTTLTVKKLQSTNYKAAFVSGWLTNADHTYTGWVQVGYTSDMMEFVQFWLKNPSPNNVSIGLPAGATATVLSSWQLITTTTHAFSIELSNHSLIVSVDGIARTIIDGVPADYIFNPEIVIEGYGNSSKPPSFPTITFSPAFEYKATVGGGWLLPTSARSYGNIGSWGAEGMIQNSVLKANEINMGSGIKTGLGAQLF